MADNFPQYGRHNDDFGEGDDSSYEDAPVAPRGAEPSNPYNGRLVPGHDWGASVPRHGDVDLSRAMRQGVDDALADAMGGRGLYTREDGGDE